jgi:hypothetical protein
VAITMPFASMSRQRHKCTTHIGFKGTVDH